MSSGTSFTSIPRERPSNQCGHTTPRPLDQHANRTLPAIGYSLATNGAKKARRQSGGPFRNLACSQSLRTDRHRRLLFTDPHPAVLRVARRRVLLILRADLRQLVRLDLLALRRGVDAEQAGGVQAENLILDRVGQRRILVLVHQLLAHLEPAQTLDLPLRAAAPD